MIPVLAAQHLQQSAAADVPQGLLGAVLVSAVAFAAIGAVRALLNRGRR